MSDGSERARGGVRAEIVAIGNEILLGDVLDTNSHWLCQQLTGLGAVVQRVTQIGDDGDVIASTLRGALKRGASLVFTTGGLGPTEDDLTLSAVAAALGRSLVEHPLAREWVEAKYEELARAGHVSSADMTASRLKMARLPQGAAPLRNQVGAAPGVLLSEQGRTIVCLPGVPDELQDILRDALRPTLSALLGEGAYEQWTLRAEIGDESVLAPLLREVSRACAPVYIKSRARRFGEDVQFLITLSARGQTVDEIRERLEQATARLRQRLADAGIASQVAERGSAAH